MAHKRHRLAERRKSVGLSQESLAEKIGVDRSTVVRWERGETHPHPWHRPRLARVLAVSIEELAGLLAQGQVAGEAAQIGGGHPQADRLTGQLRTRLLARGLASGPAATHRDPAAIEAAARTAHDAYQRADYRRAVQLLPALITDAEQLLHDSSGERLLALAYLAASKVAAKLGDGVLAWIAADRAGSLALAAGDRAVSAVGSYQVARALLQAPGRLDDAGEVLDAAIAEFRRPAGPGSPAELSACGALLLLSAVVAARRRRPTEAAGRLAAAAEIAARRPRDDNLLWTGFGPTNVRIHQVTVAMELHRPEQAIEIGDQLDTSALPPALRSRRAQVHLDLAAAFSQTTGGDPAALLHLLEAERIAPAMVHISHAARSLVAALLQHERRASTPGLRQLAARAGC